MTSAGSAILACGPCCNVAGNRVCRPWEPSFPSLPRITCPNANCSSSFSYSKKLNFHPCKRHVYDVCCSTTNASPASGSFTEDEFEDDWADDDDDDYSEEDDGHKPLNVVALEKEANDAVREYFSSIAFQAAAGKKITDLRGDWRKKLNRKDIYNKVPSHCLPKVAIVGRPNVGKSALFNRLVPGNKAIVLNEPGVTRDRLYGRSSWCDKEFLVIDTGGVHDLSESDPAIPKELAIATTLGMDGVPLHMREAAIAKMPPMIEKQAVIAVEEACVIIFLVDGQVGLTAADEQIAVWLKKKYGNKHVLLAVNKCESPEKGSMQALDFWSLGFSPLPLSVISGRGMKELLEIICSGIDQNKASYELSDVKDHVPSLAIVGRPNVGKSSILNALLGEARAIVSPISGTTRDAVDTDFIGRQGQKYRLIDTAGIRKKAAIACSRNITEALSVNRSLRAISRSDVVALVIEAMASITDQDCKIADRIEKEGKGCLIVVNKWDTIPGKNHTTQTVYERDVRVKLKSVDWAPIVYSTAITGDNIDKIITAADGVVKQRSRRLSTALLNQLVREAVAIKSPPRIRRRGGRVYYCTQAAIRPPTFVFFVNDTRFFTVPYQRYLEGKLRMDAGFFGTPLRLLFRNRKREINEGISSW